MSDGKRVVAGLPESELRWLDSFVESTEDALAAHECQDIDEMFDGIAAASDGALSLKPDRRRTKRGKVRIVDQGTRLFSHARQINQKYVSIPAADARRLVHWYQANRYLFEGDDGSVDAAQQALASSKKRSPLKNFAIHCACQLLKWLTR